MAPGAARRRKVTIHVVPTSPAEGAESVDGAAGGKEDEIDGLVIEV